MRWHHQLAAKPRASTLRARLCVEEGASNAAAAAATGAKDVWELQRWGLRRWGLRRWLCFFGSFGVGGFGAPLAGAKSGASLGVAAARDGFELVCLAATPSAAETEGVGLLSLSGTAKGLCFFDGGPSGSSVSLLRLSYLAGPGACV